MIHLSAISYLFTWPCHFWILGLLILLGWEVLTPSWALSLHMVRNFHCDFTFQGVRCSVISSCLLPDLYLFFCLCCAPEGTTVLSRCVQATPNPTLRV